MSISVILSGSDSHERSSYSALVFRRRWCPSEPDEGATTIRYLTGVGDVSRSSRVCKDDAEGGNIGSSTALVASRGVYTWNIFGQTHSTRAYL